MCVSLMMAVLTFLKLKGQCVGIVYIGKPCNRA